MRLTEQQRRIVLGAIRGVDPQAEVYLFGSRADDTALGGDIDLLVVSGRIDLTKKLDILGELHRLLGERRIDLVVAADTGDPFTRIARAEGIPL
jgi:predicted nucleotidyltransferase